MEWRILHNPRCRKSRETLELLKSKGQYPQVILYLQNPPNRMELEDLLKKLGIDACALVRREEPLYKELAKAHPPDASRCLDWICENPILIQRPVVVAGSRAVIARPPERVLDLMD